MEELLKNKLGLQVLTDTGWSDFEGLLLKGNKVTIGLEFDDGTVLRGTKSHRIYDDTLTGIPLGHLKIGNKVYGSTGIRTVVGIKAESTDPVYDLLNVAKNHRFYANDILCSNCEFIRDDETLINPLYLVTMESSSPLNKTGQIRWYKDIDKNSTYVVALDPSIGTGGDPAAIEVYELPSCQQVAEWCHNKTPVEKQIRIMSEILEIIAETVQDNTKIYYSLENNTVGEAGLVALREYGEENMRGLMLSEPIKRSTARKHRKGFTTTNSSKLAACAKMKQLVESGKLGIKSKGLIGELKNFIASGGSYAAKLGETDDLVAATLLAVRMIAHLQNYDPEIDASLRDYDDVSDLILPMPFIVM